jgi:hypothetical protein
MKSSLKNMHQWQDLLDDQLQAGHGGKGKIIEFQLI